MERRLINLSPALNKISAPSHMPACWAVTSCHLSRSISVTRPLCSSRLPKLRGAGGFWLESVTLILSCTSPGEEQSGVEDVVPVPWARGTQSHFPPGNHLAKSAQHHVLTLSLILTQGWSRAGLYSPCWEHRGICICLHSLINTFPDASCVDFSLRRMTRQCFKRFLINCQHRATGFANIFSHDLTGIAEFSMLSSSKKLFVLVLKLNNYMVHFM